MNVNRITAKSNANFTGMNGDKCETEINTLLFNIYSMRHIVITAMAFVRSKSK